MAPGQKDQLFIKDWMDHLEVSDQELGDRLGHPRVTIWRWHKEQRRLSPNKIKEIAAGLRIPVDNLYRRPGEISLDAIIKEAPELLEEAADLLTNMIRHRKKPK